MLRVTRIIAKLVSEVVYKKMHLGELGKGRLFFPITPLLSDHTPTFSHTSVCFPATYRKVLKLTNSICYETTLFKI